MEFCKLAYVVILLCLFSASYSDRSVPARTDICNRLPGFSGCPKSASDLEKASTAAASTKAPARPTTAGATTASSANNNSTTQNPNVQKLCAQYASLAQQYCVGPPNELPMAKEKCNYWRKYCKGQAATTESPLGQPPCAPYEVQYLTMCVQQQPVNQDVGRFCYAYRHACVYGKNPALLNPGFNAPVGRPLVPAASSTVVDPYPAPWSSIYTHEQRKATLLENGPLPALPNMPPPWSTQPDLSPNPNALPIGANPVNPALFPGSQLGFAPAAVPAGSAPAAVQPANPVVPAAVPQQPALPAGVPASAFPANPGAGGLGIGSGTQVGQFAGVGSNTQVNPFSGVGTNTGINAAGLPISSGGGVGFGGLIPNVGLLGGRRRRSVSLMSILRTKQRSV